jgi:hypothetical protein
MARHCAVPIIVLTALTVAACSGGGESTETSGSPTTGEMSDDSMAPTTTEQPPLSAEEQAWAGAVDRYAKRLRKQWERSGVTITQKVMMRWASLFAECAKTVRQAGDPGRYAPAARLVDRACNKLDKARRQVAIAIASTDSGGAVVSGTPEEKRFDRALNNTFELVGNALNDLSTARTQANVVEAEFGTA